MQFLLSSSRNIYKERAECCSSCVSCAYSSPDSEEPETCAFGGRGWQKGISTYNRSMTRDSSLLHFLMAETFLATLERSILDSPAEK